MNKDFLEKQLFRRYQGESYNIQSATYMKQLVDLLPFIPNSTKVLLEPTGIISLGINKSQNNLIISIDGSGILVYCYYVFGVKVSNTVKFDGKNIPRQLIKILEELK